MNAFAFWQGEEIGNATATYLADLTRGFSRIQTLSGSLTAIEIWNGETGWPTTGLASAHNTDFLLTTGQGGTNYGAAEASTENAEIFFKEGVCAALAWGFNVFYFEAFDEPWKPKSKGLTGAESDETHWGAYTAERVPKFSMRC